MHHQTWYEKFKIRLERIIQLRYIKFRVVVVERRALYNIGLLSSIYLPDSWENVYDVSIEQLLPRPTFGDTGNDMSACFLLDF